MSRIIDYAFGHALEAVTVSSGTKPVTVRLAKA